MASGIGIHPHVRFGSPSDLTPWPDPHTRPLMNRQDSGQKENEGGSRCLSLTSLFSEGESVVERVLPDSECECDADAPLCLSIHHTKSQIHLLRGHYSGPIIHRSLSHVKNAGGTRTDPRFLFLWRGGGAACGGQCHTPPTPVPLRPRSAVAAPRAAMILLRPRRISGRPRAGISGPVAVPAAPPFLFTALAWERDARRALSASAGAPAR